MSLHMHKPSLATHEEVFLCVSTSYRDTLFPRARSEGGGENVEQHLGLVDLKEKLLEEKENGKEATNGKVAILPLEYKDTGSCGQWS
ncbi:Uncharacterized protein DAT39_007366 [Clarias magur]|uniref:Uncharacterized protein n=1 Tax=Clarias magur TaxID=1594786 RepID=A0A8J4X613_CLAMG|nr:Uncharacterized protein DAT39_007366 [Clarias magur]